MSDNKAKSKNSVPRIFTVGETTYDILFRNGTPEGGCSGGSAFNSAVSLGRAGLPVSLITTFANDRIGDLALSMLENNKVDCSRIKRYVGRSRVALAFIDENQNPDYSFYPGSEEAVPDYPEPQENDIILLGSSFALRDTGRRELLEFLQISKNKGSLIIYDPNARRHLAHVPGMVKKILQNIGFATIVKGSDEDFLFIFGKNDSRGAYKEVRRAGAGYLAYTKGSEGVELITPVHHLQLKPDKIKVISTIGAGDNFSAGMISGIYLKRREGLSLKDYASEDWMDIIKLGNFFSGKVCQSHENYIPIETGEWYRNQFNP